MAGKRFLTGIRTDFITINDSPILPTDGANKGYVDALTFDALNNVNTTGIVTDDGIKWNGSQWVPTAIPGGPTTEATINQITHGFSVTDVVRVSSGSWIKAQSNNVNTMGVGVVVAVPDSNNFTVAMSGRYNLPAHGLTAENYYFLSDSVAGGITGIEPPISQPVIYIEDADNIWVLPYRGSVQYDSNAHSLVWKDLFGPLGQARTTGNASPAWGQISTSGVYGYFFSPTQLNELQVTFHLDHDYALGTNIFPHVHWLPVNGTAGTVRWIMEILYAKGHQQSVFNVGAPTQLVIEQSTNSTAWQHMVGEAELSAFTANLEPDGILMIRVYRDAAHANDTYSGDVVGVQLDIHYQANAIGTINKAPNFYA